MHTQVMVQTINLVVLFIKDSQRTSQTQLAILQASKWKQMLKNCHYLDAASINERTKPPLSHWAPTQQEIHVTSLLYLTSYILTILTSS